MPRCRWLVLKGHGVNIDTETSARLAGERAAKRGISAMPLIAEGKQTSQKVRVGPTTDIQES
jgi:hypothetical protein